MRLHLAASLTLLVFLTACASSPLPEGLQSTDSIFSNHSSKGVDQGQPWYTVGHDKSGYVAPDRSDSRKEFEDRFPPVELKDNFLEVFDKGYLEKVGQVVAWSIDLDARTSGFLKADGRGISVTGRFNFDSAATMNSAAIQSASTTMLSSAATGFQVTPGVSPVVGGLGVGLIGGLIAGAITAHAVESTVNGFISSDGFGARLQHASGMAAHQMHIPRMRAISEYYYSRGEPERISKNAYRFIFSREGDKNIDYSTRIFFASTVAVYRGKRYEEVYPSTKGWEFIVTNLNFVDVRVVDRDRLATLRNIRRELEAKGIKM